MQAKAMHQDRQHRCQDEAASRGHVSVGHVLVAGDHVVQVDHIAPWHGQQAAQQIDLRRPTLAPHPHAPQRAKDGKAQGGEQEDGDKGVQHGKLPKDTSVPCQGITVGAGLASDADTAQQQTRRRSHRRQRRLPQG
ncbi:hypothetical protein D3C81_1129390 [compost metagenome]